MWGRYSITVDDRKLADTSGARFPSRGMPVILPLYRERNWLVPADTPFFIPFPAELTQSYRVTEQINRANFKSPQAFIPLQAAVA